MTVNYYLARFRAPKVGKRVAELIDWLHEETGMSFETTHVYGYSLGAHVAGFTGKQTTKGKVKVIIGLDAVHPLFRIKNPENRLSSTDAEYVEAIHTNGQGLGFYHPIAVSDFYPNGGRAQPGCGFNPLSCSHSRAATFFAESVAMGERSNYHTVKCETFADVKNRTCSLDSEGIRMGHKDNIKSAKGIYFLETKAEAPYAVGDVY